MPLGLLERKNLDLLTDRKSALIQNTPCHRGEPRGRRIEDAHGANHRRPPWGRGRRKRAGLLCGQALAAWTMRGGEVLERTVRDWARSGTVVVRLRAQGPDPPSYGLEFESFGGIGGWESRRGPGGLPDGILGRPVGLLGGSCGLLGGSWGVQGGPEELLGRSGGVLGPTWAIFWDSWGCLGPSGGVRRVAGRRLGGSGRPPHGLRRPLPPVRGRVCENAQKPKAFP